MKIRLSATALVVFTTLSCFPAQRLLAQEALPVAGPAIASNNNNSNNNIIVDGLPAAGPAIQPESRRSSSRSTVISRVESRRSSRRSTAISGEQPRRSSRRSTAISRPESRPRVRPVTDTPQRQTPSRRRIKQPTTPVQKAPSVSPNFPIRLW